MKTQKEWSNVEVKQLAKLRGEGKIVREISAALNRTFRSVKAKIASGDYPLGESEVKSNLKYDVDLEPAEFGRLPLKVIDNSDWFTFGLVADTHLACREERLDALHCQYDLFAKEKIVNVLHAGNICDGYVPRINGASVIESSIDGQAQYVVDNYPQRKGITTHFVTGNDHEGWWSKEGFNFGAYLSYVAKSQNRNDLNYIGHVEADAEIKTGAKKSTIIRVAHPGGGCPYARSYVAQKTVESYEGGEKPAILVLGHHHVGNYLNERNIHVVNLPGFQSQTIFGRTKKLRYEIGGAIMRFKVNPEDGTVTRFQLEFTMFFDRGYYKTFLQSDTKLLKGHLVIKP